MSIVRLAKISLTLVTVIITADLAMACPMCKAAAESDPKLPNAFLASILFMLAMPFTLATCFGVAFYRLSKRSQSAQSDADLSADELLS